MRRSSKHLEGLHLFTTVHSLLAWLPACAGAVASAAGQGVPALEAADAETVPCLPAFAGAAAGAAGQGVLALGSADAEASLACLPV